jgi:hypothetical protein
MKTIKLIALAICLLTMLGSCTKADEPRDPYPDEIPEIWDNAILDVDSEHWRLVGNPNEIGSYYEYTFTGFPYTDGIVSVYLYEYPGDPKERQLPLPLTDYIVEIFNDGSELHYSIQYSYEIAKNGVITLKVFRSDFMTGHFRPVTLKFRVAIIY